MIVLGHIDKSTSTRIDSIRDKVIEYLLSYQPNTSKEEKSSQQKPPQPSNNIIWNNDDFLVFRGYLKDQKEENMLLKSQLRAKQDELIELRDRLENVECELKKSPKSLVESLEKQNQRLYMRIGELETQYSTYLKEMAVSEKAIDEIKQENNNLMLKINDLKTEKHKLEYKFNKCQLKLRLVGSEIATKMEQEKESIRIKHAREVKELTESQNDLRRKLEHEINEHQKCKKALENLTNHFICSSKFEERLTSISKDTKISFYN